MLQWFFFRYIGGCCGFEPYLIRAIAEELREERKGLPYSSRFTCLKVIDTFHWSFAAHRKSDEVNLQVWKNIEGRQERHRGKGSREYWDALTPCTGRPLSAALCRSCFFKNNFFQNSSMSPFSIQSLTFVFPGNQIRRLSAAQRSNRKLLTESKINLNNE